MTVEIDRNSGFCKGVIRAIDGAEKLLAEGGVLYSLGAIVHNEAELARWRAKGLITLESLDAEPASLLIRAHGEPPETYRLAREKGFEVVGVSLDYKQEDWEKCVQEMGINWPQMSDLKGWDSEVCGLYNVYGIPMTLLYDPDGKVVAYWLHGETLGQKLAEIFE